jgi:hypothetical protein
MKKPLTKKDDPVFYIGIVAMVLLLVGVFSEPASLLQRSLFLVGAIGLAFTAYTNKQWMLFVLQIVISIGSVFAFVQISHILKYVLLLGASLAGIAYLRSRGRYSTDVWGIVSSIGLFLIAAGLATDAIAHPFFFGLFLGVGSLLVASYSFVDYFINKHDPAMIWLVLNIVFAINPLLMAISAFMGRTGVL